MQRYKLLLEYDGTGFNGWQRQKNGFGVQQALEDAVKEFCGEDVTVFGAGRTDAGVHAFGQVAHFDVDKPTDANIVRKALNHHLRKATVSVLTAEEVTDEFHSRFSALQRAYVYRIINRRAPLTLERDRAWWVPVTLDADLMNEAAQVLMGKHDFSTFRAADCQADGPLKTLDEISVERDGEEIRIHVRAKSFLYHQVRNFAGSLKIVGEGRWSTDDFKKAFEAADRTQGGPTAPAEGLYFVEVVY